MRAHHWRSQEHHDQAVVDLGAACSAYQDGALTTPAMAAGLADHVWTLTEIAALLD